MMPLKRTLLVSAALCLSVPHSAHALRYILDTEINGALSSMLEELDPTLAPEIKLHLALEPDVNAFVTTGNRMFIFSGLIEKTDAASELQGVLAHELAHLKAGHLEEGRYAQEKASRQGIVSALLGIGAAVAGAPNAAGAIVLGGQASARSGVLSHSRTAENEADTLAAQYLTQAGYGLKGMVDFFRKLHSHTQLRFNAAPPYLLTHPLPAQRLDSLKHKQDTSPIQTHKEPPVNYARLKAKVYALAHTPNQVLRRYHGDTSKAAIYARAVAYSHSGQSEKAKAALAKLPPSPFHEELLGDMALDAGDLEAAHAYFTRAQETLNSPLIAYKLAQTAQAQGRYGAAFDYIKQLFPAYGHLSAVWQRRGTIAGQAGDKLESHLSLAEAAFRQRDSEALRVHIALSEQFLEKESNATKRAHAEIQILSLKEALEDSK